MKIELYQTNSANESEQVGEMFGKTLKTGDIVALYGEIGAGKTTITKGIAKGLGFCERITSPTFAIVNEYKNERFRLCHFDMYRISNEDELYEIGWEEYLSEKCICILEWSENVENAIPPHAIKIHIKKDGNTQRTIEIMR